MPIGTVATEYRGLADDELISKLAEAKEELFNLRFQAASSYSCMSPPRIARRRIRPRTGSG